MAVNQYAQKAHTLNKLKMKDLEVQVSYDKATLINDGWVYQFNIREDGGMLLHHYYLDVNSESTIGMVAAEHGDTLQPQWFYQVKKEDFRRTV